MPRSVHTLGSEGSLISGIRVIQNKDFSFTWHMSEYVEKQMSLIKTPRGLLSSSKELTDEYMSQVISCNGKIGWLGGNGRPDVAAGHSIIAGEYKDKSPSLITSCNQWLRTIKLNCVFGQFPFKIFV